MRTFIAFVLFGLVALGAGSLGYQAGVASTVGDAGRVIFLGGGPGFGTFLFLFFLFGLVMLVTRPRRHATWGRHGMWGHGPWSAGPWGAGPTGDQSDPRRTWVAEAHRRLHEEEARTAGSTTPGSTATGTATGAPPTAG